jgi:hypothetical protein
LSAYYAHNVNIYAIIIAISEYLCIIYAALLKRIFNSSICGTLIICSAGCRIDIFRMILIVCVLDTSNSDRLVHEIVHEERKTNSSRLLNF